MNLLLRGSYDYQRFNLCRLYATPFCRGSNQRGYTRLVAAIGVCTLMHKLFNIFHSGDLHGEHISSAHIGIGVKVDGVVRPIMASSKKIEQLQNIIASFIEDNDIAYSKEKSFIEGE